MVVGFCLWHFCHAMLRCENRFASTASREGRKSSRCPVQCATPPQGPGEINPRVLPRTRYERTERLRRELQSEVPCVRAL